MQLWEVTVGKFSAPGSLRPNLAAFILFLLVFHLANTGRLLWTEHRVILAAIRDLFFPFGAFMLLAILIAVMSVAALAAHLAGTPVRDWRLRTAAALAAAGTLVLTGIVFVEQIELFLSDLDRLDPFALFFAAAALNAIAWLVLALKPLVHSG